MGSAAYNTGILVLHQSVQHTGHDNKVPFEHELIKQLITANNTRETTG
jgi:hypothetical protein